jgi:tetratricopeptide (TPR) repeat protein
VQALLEEALRHNESPATWGMLAWTYVHDVRFSPDRPRKLKRAVEAAERSVKLAPTSDTALTIRGLVYLEEGRLVLALKMFERAIVLNPKNAWAIASRGSGLLHLGRPQEALESVRQAMRLSPNDPGFTRWQTMEGMALLHLGEGTAAVQSLTQGLKAPTPHPFVHLYLASALAFSGRIEEARALVAQFPQLYPGVTVSRWRALEVSDAPEFLKQRERVYEGLRRAGMPE